MLFFKFSLSLALIILSFPALSNIGFSDKECLNASFETEISHRGQPFGLLENILRVEKEGCIISIYHERFKFLKKEWEIDVCRSPVHIKSGAGAVKVLRRERDCRYEEIPSDFCSEVSDLKRIVEDDGLIFAPGERERIGDPHGQVTCIVSLLNKYLEQGKVLSRHGGHKKAEDSAPPPAPPAKTSMEKSSDEEQDEDKEILDGLESDFEVSL